VANAVHRKILVATGVVDFSTHLNGLLDADLCWSDPITDCGACYEVEFFAALKTGTSPTPNQIIEMYIGRADDHASEIRAGSGVIDTNEAGTETSEADIDAFIRREA